LSGRLLLDTNAVIALFRDDPSAKGKLKDAEEVFLPSIVLGELLYGALRSGRKEENAARCHRFAAANTVLACDAATAEEYALIENGLRVRGTPIPDNDVWISALALQHGLAVLTRDGHFGSVAALGSGFTAEAW
jgi:tRNA(fMet)-specific endonuclease VapC